jgi:hypothetical protein
MNCGKDDSGTCCGFCDKKVVVVICTHARVDITTRNIKSLQLQTPKPTIVVVCSSQPELEHYKELGVTVALEPNRPLGRKWQVGVNIAHKLNCDALIILGSDDILRNDFFRVTLSKIALGYEFIGSTEWYMQDVKGKEFYHCKYIHVNKDFPIGSGKVYAKSILEKCRWKIFDTTADRKLDDQGVRMVQNVGAKSYLFREPLVLAVKGGWNEMNPAHAYKSSRNIDCRLVNSDILKKFDV